MTALAGIAPADGVRTVLAVPGMHCAGCMGKVERALTAMPGVATARVNLSARTALLFIYREYSNILIQSLKTGQGAQIAAQNRLARLAGP